MLNLKHNTLLYEYVKREHREQIDVLRNDFCGKTYSDITEFNKNIDKLESNSTLYICGDINFILNNLSAETVKKVVKINIIGELSYESGDDEENFVDSYWIDYIFLGEVPINMHNVGVYFKQLFYGDSYYNDIVSEHEFQDLTLGRKAGTAFRKGIYLTPVERNLKNYSNHISFKLLRCSTNLSGPTDNFRKTDNEIVDKVNQVSKRFFNDGAQLNHVLAQTYHNHVDLDEDGFEQKDGKQRKAKISQHSDKTKDMPENGLMAFCTFYKDLNTLTEEKGVRREEFDYLYGKTSTVLTKLRFKVKPEALDNQPRLKKYFDITLYPNSVFMMNLETNRLYTHEIVPSSLPVDKIPTRMGYVIRCSNTDAIYDLEKKKTFIVSSNNGKLVELEESTYEGLKELKRLYFAENTTIEKVDYIDKFFFSMNGGDYMKPIL
jgi:hypothetical protein